MIIYYLPPCTRTSKIIKNPLNWAVHLPWQFHPPWHRTTMTFSCFTWWRVKCDIQTLDVLHTNMYIIIYVIKHICMYLYQKIQSHYWQYNKSSENNMPNVCIIRSYVICVLYQEMDSLCCIWTQWLVERTHHRLIFWGFPHADLFGTVPSIYADVGEKCS